MRTFKRLDVCVGVENLTNYRQPNPINGAADPFRPDFDAAMVWDQYMDDLPVRIHATALSSMAKWLIVQQANNFLPINFSDNNFVIAISTTSIRLYYL